MVGSFLKNELLYYEYRIYTNSFTLEKEVDLILLRSTV